MSTTITKGVPTEIGSLRVELFSGGKDRGQMVNIIHNEGDPIIMTLKTFNRFLYNCSTFLFLRRYNMKHPETPYADTRRTDDA